MATVFGAAGSAIGAFLVLIIIFGIGGLILLALMVRVVKEYERGVVFRLGRVLGSPKGPGLILLIPIIDQMQRIDLRTIAMDVPPQDVITSDNVTLKVNAVVYFRVMNPRSAVVQVENYLYATNQLSQTSLRAVLGQSDLDEILTQRDKINQYLQEILDKETDPWGIKVSQVEIKHVDLPSEMHRAMAKQAEAERERRAKIIHAEGEFQAAAKLKDAATMIQSTPMALQLRFLQTLTEVAAENNSTLVFPVPIDLFKPFMEYVEKKGD